MPNKWCLLFFIPLLLPVIFAIEKLKTDPEIPKIGSQPVSPLINNQAKKTKISAIKNPFEIFDSMELPTTQIEKFNPLFPLLKNTTSQSSKKIAETSVTSDKLEIFFNENQSEFSFTGNVELLASTFLLQCTAAKVITYGKKMNLDFTSIKQILITGPLFLQQDERSCSANQAEITPMNTTITLSGNVTVKDPAGTILCNEMLINYETKSIKISGTPNNSPVTVNITDLCQNSVP
ncbi:MAG: LptA/OstA family protein [Puniceicoccales bacterium]|jgi:lipopolysaccharide export system protein LptA|nr:LptA/OstA family protein [Puniceicoccales bacterium]